MINHIKHISADMQAYRCLTIILLCFLSFGIIIAGRPDVKVAAGPVSCYGKADGNILINLSDSIHGPFQITVKDSSSKILAKFDNGNKIPFQVKNLKAGNYKVLYYADGKTDEHLVKISSPDLLKSNTISIIELKGKVPNIKATLESNPTGGNLPYTISWSDNTGKQTGKIAKNLPMGIYKCTIDDSKQCGPVTATFFLYEDEIQKYNNKKNKD